MKVCILGPVITKSYFGGVATFDEGLAEGFVENGWSAFLATDQVDSVQSLDARVPVYKINKRTFKDLMKIENPDYIIAQLAYAKYLVGVKTSAKKIYFLHAFFKESYYGLLKSRLAVIYQKFLINNCDLVFSNSYFTEMINNDFFRIKSDAVFHIGVAPDFYKRVEMTKSKEKVAKSVFFAGRLVPAKGASVLVDAAKLLSEKGVEYKLYIAGDGVQKRELQERIESLNLSVELLGRIEQNEIVEYYMKSEIFVSLDPSEPFGIVFPEALLSECKIVCPITGGQVEYLNKYPKNVSYVDVRSAESVAQGIEQMLNYGERPNLSLEEKQGFTYKNVASKMIAYLEGVE